MLQSPRLMWKYGDRPGRLSGNVLGEPFVLDLPRPASESLLLRRAGAGDERAQAELLDHYRGRLLRMVGQRLDRRMAARLDASDIIQDAMKDAFNRLPDYFRDPQIPVYPWLRRIAMDRLMDAYRTHLEAGKRSVLKEQNGAAELNDESAADLVDRIVASSLNPGQRAIQAETQARVKAALLELKPQDREVLALRYLEQLDVEEIAAVLGTTRTTVTSRHLRALQRLRRQLGNDFGG